MNQLDKMKANSFNVVGDSKINQLERLVPKSTKNIIVRVSNKEGVSRVRFLTVTDEVYTSLCEKMANGRNDNGYKIESIDIDTKPIR